LAGDLSGKVILKNDDHIIFMKKILLIFLALVAFTLSNCGSRTGKDTINDRNQSSAEGEARIVFNEYEHSFGKVAEGEKVSCTFTFENKGTGNLIVKSASTTCGCTIPKYDKKPIAPGGSGTLEVIFDTTGKNGMQTKTITVNSNASKPVVLLKVTAEVVTKIN
jgi:hypothetical protein